jgi:hypothetical protein
MTYENTIKLVFSTLVTSEFTLGKNNRGYPRPTLAQDMVIQEDITSPLIGNNQTLVIGQEPTIVDGLKLSSIAGSLAANPSGSASVSVVWTNYQLALRFGLSAAISTSRLDAVKAAVESEFTLGLASAPAPELTWSYMMDCAPDQPVVWMKADSLTTGLTRGFPCNSAYQLFIQPVVGEYTINVAAQVQLSSAG